MRLTKMPQPAFRSFRRGAELAFLLGVVGDVLLQPVVELPYAWDLSTQLLRVALVAAALAVVDRLVEVGEALSSVLPDLTASPAS
jgi:hypothetical protein